MRATPRSEGARASRYSLRTCGCCQPVVLVGWSNTHMLTLTTAETLAIDNSMDHLAPGNGRIYPSLVPEQGGPGAGDIEAGLWERPVKTRVGVPTRLI